jgi:hypothetical protein
LRLTGKGNPERFYFTDNEIKEGAHTRRVL